MCHKVWWNVFLRGDIILLLKHIKSCHEQNNQKNQYGPAYAEMCHNAMKITLALELNNLQII